MEYLYVAHIFDARYNLFVKNHPILHLFMPEERDRLKQLTKGFQPDASPLPKEKRDDLVARVCFEAQRGRKVELNDSSLAKIEHIFWTC